LNEIINEYEQFADCADCADCAEGGEFLHKEDEK